jgi:4-hydroxybenzoate polyprenyltransferase
VTKHLRLVIAIARPAALFLFAMCGAIGVGLGGHANDRLLMMRVIATVLGFVLLSVVVNDLADAEIDRVNCGSRPLAAGTFTTTTFRAIAVAAGATSVVGAATLGGRPLAVVLGGIALSLAYSVRPIRLSDRGALTSLLLPFGYVAVPFLVGLFATGAAFTQSSSIVLGGLYVGFIGRLLLKDFRDVRGDALFGKRTFLVRYGRGPTCVASAVCLGASNVALVGVPGDTQWLRVVHGVLTALAAEFLHELHGVEDRRREEWLISAVAILGRGMLVSVFMYLALFPTYGPFVSIPSLALVAAVTVAQAQRMRRHGPRFGAKVPAEWSVDRTPVAPQ